MTIISARTTLCGDARRVIQARMESGQVPLIETVHYPIQGTIRLFFSFPDGFEASLLVKP